MSEKNSKVDDDHKYEPKTAHASSLRSKNSIEQERRRKLVKFNAVAAIKELSEDSNESKINLLDVGKQPEPTVSTSTPPKDNQPSISFHSKRRSHYKNEFTNSKTNKQSEQSD